MRTPEEIEGEAYRLAGVLAKAGFGRNFVKIYVTEEELAKMKEDLNNRKTCCGTLPVSRKWEIRLFGIGLTTQILEFEGYV